MQMKFYRQKSHDSVGIFFILLNYPKISNSKAKKSCLFSEEYGKWILHSHEWEDSTNVFTNSKHFLFLYNMLITIVFAFCTTIANVFCKSKLIFTMTTSMLFFSSFTIITNVFSSSSIFK